MERRAGGELNDGALKAGNHMPACVQACPTNALTFGDQNDAHSPVSPYFEDVNRYNIHHEKERKTRGYRVLEEMNTKPNVIYLKKVDPNLGDGHHG